MNSIIIITIIISILILLVLGFYIITRIEGCMDKDSITYNPYANIHNKNMCVYEKVGCIDPKFTNYNKSATISCSEDCSKCGKYNTTDCKYCEFHKSCSPDLRCKDLKINYYEIKNSLQIMSSNKKLVVTLDGKLLLDSRKDGLKFIILTRYPTLKPKSITNFDINYCYQINNMIDFIKNIKYDDIVIVSSKGDVFDKLTTNSNLANRTNNLLKKLGKKINFQKNYNYILIGSKKQDIYYETTNYNPVFYPYIEFRDIKCKVNPANIYPLKNDQYLFYRERSSSHGDILATGQQDHIPFEIPTEAKVRCALEADRLGTDTFGFELDRCVPITKDKIKSYQSMYSSDNCLDNMGEMGHMSVYKFNKKKSFKNLDSVHIFSEENYTGNYSVLQVGRHIKPFGNILKAFDDIKSFIIPPGFIVITLDENKKAISYNGPKRINKNEQDIKTIFVYKITKDSVVFCNDSYGNGGCYVLGPGQHEIPHYLFIKVRFVNLGPNVKKVVLYNDLNLRELAREYENDERLWIKHEVTLPQIIRSVKILSK